MLIITHTVLVALAALMECTNTPTSPKASYWNKRLMDKNNEHTCTQRTVHYLLCCVSGHHACPSVHNQPIAQMYKLGPHAVCFRSNAGVNVKPNLPHCRDMSHEGTFKFWSPKPTKKPTPEAQCFGCNPPCTGTPS